jgi:FlaA1/EpsC-like NDP-sugar epimerase
VAFSDGSLLHGFNQRFSKRQPISAPNDVLRYFVTPEESGQLCLLSCMLGGNRDIFFPKLSDELRLTAFSDIAERYLLSHGFEPHHCNSESEARDRARELISNKKWPCYFFPSDTTGEKDFEEFYTDKEVLNMNLFKNIGIIKNESVFDNKKLDEFIASIKAIDFLDKWEKSDIVKIFSVMIPDFKHIEKGKYLDGKM